MIQSLHHSFWFAFNTKSWEILYAYYVCFICLCLNFFFLQVSWKYETQYLGGGYNLLNLVDIFMDIVGTWYDPDYYKTDIGPLKQFPGGYTCVFIGKEVPFMVCCSKKGRVATELSSTFSVIWTILSSSYAYILLVGCGQRWCVV